MISKPLSRCDPSHPACLRRQHMMLIYGLTIIYGWLTRLMYARRPWGSWPLEILLIKSCIALGMGWNSCFQPKTLLLALFWVNRGDILGNEIFDFGLMHRKSSCLFIISLECFCLWIWNIKMAIVQTIERTYPCHFQTFELRPSTRVYVRRKFGRRDGISGTFLNQHMISYI